MNARAYINHGRWVADCPEPDCWNAAELTPGQFVLSCITCQRLAEIAWPPAREAHEIWLALAERENMENRNWFPAGHELALTAGLPHGQSASELVAEAHTEVARFRAEQDAAAAAAGREEIFAEAARLVRQARKERNERWADEGHGRGGPAFHLGSDEDGFPPESTWTRGPDAVSTKGGKR